MKEKDFWQRSLYLNYNRLCLEKYLLLKTMKVPTFLYRKLWRTILLQLQILCIIVTMLWTELKNQFSRKIL